MTLANDNFFVVDFLVSGEPALWGLFLVVAFEVFSRAASDNSNGSKSQAGTHFPGACPPNGEDEPDRWKKVARKVLTLVLVTASVGLVAWWVWSSGGEVPPPSSPRVEPFVVADALAELIVRLEKPGSAAVALVNSSLPEVHPGSPLAEVAAERLFDHLFDSGVSQVNDLLGQSITMANRGIPKEGPPTLTTFVETIRTGAAESKVWLAWDAKGKLIPFLEGLNPTELKVVLETYLKISQTSHENFTHWAQLALQDHLERFPYQARRLTPKTMEKLYHCIDYVARGWSEGSQFEGVQRSYLRRLVESGSPVDEANQARLAFNSFRYYGNEIAKESWMIHVKGYGPLFRWDVLVVILSGNPWGRLKRWFFPVVVGVTTLVGGWYLWVQTGSVGEVFPAELTRSAINTVVAAVPTDHSLLELARRNSRPSPGGSVVSASLWFDSPGGLTRPTPEGRFVDFARDFFFPDYLKTFEEFRSIALPLCREAQAKQVPAPTFNL